MKNVYKLLGIAVLAMAVVFSFAACGDKSSGDSSSSGSGGGNFSVKVVNNHATYVITGVKVDGPGDGYLNKTGLSIGPGQSQTFSFTDDSSGMGTGVYLTFNNDSKRIGTYLQPGKTRTITLDASGYLSSDQ